MAVITTRAQASRSAYKRPELREILPLYRLIKDVLAGSVSVKRRGALYLPIPNATDTSRENLSRYDAYKVRAVFYNVTRRTLEGFVGELFDSDPVITIPPSMQLLIEDVNGEGVGIVQMAKQLAGWVTSLGRAGLFTDYPNTKGATTKADLIERGIRPIVRAYDPEKIINWRYKKIGALNKLCLIVLEEEYDKADNGFELAKGKQWRVLRLDDSNRYTQALYRDTSGDVPVDEDGKPADVITPTKADGTPFDSIPFTFIGAKANNADVDYPPLFDLADLNIAHYRNSADYEEATYICGQPTVWVSGLNQDWADKYYKEGVPLGARAALVLPVNGAAGIMQAQETTMSIEAMRQKEQQMVALGAKIVESKTVQRTATETSIDSASEKSTLATIADNLSVAMEWALGWAAEYMGTAESKIVVAINKEFSIAFTTPEARKEAIEAWVSEAISWTEMRAALKKGGTATLPDDQARTEIKTDAINGDGPTEPGLTDAEGNPIDAQGNPIDPATGKAKIDLTNPDPRNPKPEPKKPVKSGGE